MIKGVFFEARTASIIIFIIVGLIFLILEKYRDLTKNHLELSTIAPKQAVLIGFAQALAVMPGVSRAGAVLIAMLFLGFKRDESAKYSFLLAIPTILAAAVFDLISVPAELYSNNQFLMAIIIGNFIAFVSAYLAVKWLIGFLSKHSLVIFGWYRVIIGLILFALGRN